MNDRDLAAIMGGVTPVLRDHFSALSARLIRDAEQAEAVRAAEHRALMAETRESLATMKRDIEARLAEVRDGKDGVDGRDGADGADGRDGANGIDGKDGADGAAGRDGIDGANGKDGLDGAAGADGKDGEGVEDILIEQDGDILTFGFTVGGVTTQYEARLPAGPAGKDGGSGERGEKGEPGQDGRDAYAGEARGLFDPAATYRAMDVVSLNGSEWRAKRDNPGELPGDGWMLSAGRGKRGDRGERGLEGRQGDDGKPGASVIAGYVDPQDMKMTLTRDDGAEVKVDFYELADAVRTTIQS